MKDDPRSTIGYPNERCTSLHPLMDARCDLSLGHEDLHEVRLPYCKLYWLQTNRNGDTVEHGHLASIPMGLKVRVELPAAEDEPTLRDLAHMLSEAAAGAPMPRWWSNADALRPLGEQLQAAIDAADDLAEALDL